MPSGVYVVPFEGDCVVSNSAAGVVTFSACRANDTLWVGNTAEEIYISRGFSTTEALHWGLGLGSAFWFLVALMFWIKKMLRSSAQLGDM